MRIALLIDDRYPHAGGTARVCETIAEHASKAGHEVMVFCPRRSHASAHVHLTRSLRLPPFPEGTLAPSTKDKTALLAFRPDITHTHSDRGAFLWAEQLRHKHGIAHLHTLHADYSVLHEHYTAAAMLSLLAGLAVHKLPVDVSLPPSLEDYYGRRDKILKLDWYNLARLAANTSGFTTPSPRIFQFLQKVGVAKHGKLLPFGLNDDWYATAPAIRSQQKKVPTILSVGRLDPEKRVNNVIEGFRLLRARGHTARLVIVGSGSAKARLETQARQTGFFEDIVFHGKVTNTRQLQDIYRQASLFALSSYHYETQGLVLLEAAASGLPLVYCDERLKVGTGHANSILVAPNAADFAEAFEELLTHPAKQQAMALASLEEAKRYPLNQFLSTTFKMYRELAGA